MQLEQQVQLDLRDRAAHKVRKACRVMLDHRVPLGRKDQRV